ncbi:hypothetical protein HDV63DRAFT_388045 [Trichoderma sp. SZMC 28014]
MTIHLFIYEALVSAAMYTRIKRGGGPSNQDIPYAELRACDVSHAAGNAAVLDVLAPENRHSKVKNRSHRSALSFPRES